MKKILFVITKSNWGGAQRYVYDLATSLPDSFACEVALGGDSLLKQKLEEKGIKVIQIPHLQRDISVIKEFRAFFFLLQFLRKNSYDIVHLNSSKAGGLGALAARIAGVRKIIFTAHGWPFWEQRNFLSRALIYFLSWLTVLLSHKVIVVSNYDLRVAQKMPFIVQKAVRIYNGIDRSLAFESGEKIRGVFPVGAKIIGTIGELTKNKNQIALIEQAKNNPDMFVAIVGEGEERSMLESKIKKYGLENRAKLFGFMPANEVLKGFDVFALPSIKEGLPYVLLEAKLAGLPIQANRVGGVGEILDSKNTEDFSLARMLEKTAELYR